MTLRFKLAAFALAMLAAGARGDAPQLQPEVRGGLAAFHAGDMRAARAQWLEAARAQPDLALTHALLARVAIELDDAATADAQLKRALALGTKPADVAHLAGEVRLMQGQAKAALAAADAGAVAPRFAAYAARVRAQTQAALGDNAAAEREFGLTLKLAPKSAASWVAYGRYKLGLGDRAGAASAAERAIAAQPRNAEALVFTGNLIRDRDGLIPALAWYDRALAIQPGRIDALFERAATLGDAGRATEALAATRALLAVSPNNAGAFYMQAVIAARAGKWDIARRLMFRVGARMDGVPGAVMLRAMTELQANAFDGAITRLRPLADAQPGNARVRRLLGLALWRAGSREDAIAVLQPLADRGDGYALTLAGRVLEAMGNRAAAADALDRAAHAGVVPPDPAAMAALDRFIAANPGNAWAQRAAADRAMAQGQWGSAATLYEALATRLGQRDPARLVSQGWAMVGVQQPGSALPLGARAYALAPMNPLATASYGAFLARNGRAAEAVAILEKAVALAPGEARFREELVAARAALAKARRPA